MREQPEWRMTPAARIVRGLWPDHNPLRRTSDRAEAGIVAGLIAAFLIGAPLIALTAWRLAYGAAFTTADAEHAGWRPVPAVLLISAPYSYGSYGSDDAIAPAQWTAPDGASRRGQISAIPGSPAGTTVTIWTSHSGQLTSPPLSPAQAAMQANFVAAAIVPCWALILVSTGLLSHHLLDARRLTAWDADWQTSHLSGPAGANPGP